MTFSKVLLAFVCAFKSTAGLQDINAGIRHVGSPLRSPPSPTQPEIHRGFSQASEALQQRHVSAAPTGGEEKLPLLGGAWSPLNAAPAPLIGGASPPSVMAPMPDEALVQSPVTDLDTPYSDKEVLVAADLGPLGLPDISAVNANSQNGPRMDAADSALLVARSSIASEPEHFDFDVKLSAADAHTISLEYSKLAKDATRVAAHYHDLEGALSEVERVVESVSGDGAITPEKDRQSDLPIASSTLSALSSGKAADSVNSAGVMLEDFRNQHHPRASGIFSQMTNSTNSTDPDDEKSYLEKTLTFNGKIPFGVGIVIFILVDVAVLGCCMIMSCALMRGV